jgi:hypothetical protein
MMMKIMGLNPVEMTVDIMEFLERRGLIIRLCRLWIWAITV